LETTPSPAGLPSPPPPPHTHTPLHPRPPHLITPNSSPPTYAQVKTLIKNSRSGSFPVRQDNHLLVLNWNAQTVPLLRQIAQAKAAGAAFQFQPVVVLADKGKAEMDALISEGLRGYDLEVYTRKGSPVKMTVRGGGRSELVVQAAPGGRARAVARQWWGGVGWGVGCSEGLPGAGAVLLVRAWGAVQGGGGRGCT
jgi:hypothetical protein